MTATRTLTIAASALVSAAFAVLLLAGFQAVATAASASSYTAPAYGSAILDAGDEF